MMTFPSDLAVSFQPGVNVVFGGNHSGKTTIVNSIRYAVFGLSSSQTDEQMEKRYFSHRIRESDRRSLDVSTVYNVKPKTTFVKRTVFSSGSAELRSSTSKGSLGQLSKSAEIVVRERDYNDTLRENMGSLSDEQLRFIQNLVFADENRTLVLWSRNLEDLILGLLISSENIEKLGMVESQLRIAKEDLDKIERAKDQQTKKKSEQERISDFLRERLRRIELQSTDKHVREYRTLTTDLDKCRNKRAELKDTLQNKLTERADLLTKLSNNQRKLLEMEKQSEGLQTELMKTVINSKDAKEVHLGRYFYYGKKCPFCSHDLTDEINLRLENRKCPVCGQGELTSSKVDTNEIVQKLDMLDRDREMFTASNAEIQKQIETTNRKTEELTVSSEQERVRESYLLEKLDENKLVEESLREKEMVSKELEELREQMDSITKIAEATEKESGKVTVEIMKIEQLKSKLRTVIKEELDLALAGIRGNFSSFINTATNGELRGELATSLVPILNGRSIFYPEQASQFERTLMDSAFRIALLSEFAERTNTTPSLVLETPDEVTDEAYVPYLAEALSRSSTGLSLVVTTVNSEMLRHLLEKHTPNERRKRLTDLVSKGTLTQRKYYKLPLSKFLGGD
jgi:DNA repair exonuclease SbcCD ATPase subunit